MHSYHWDHVDAIERHPSNACLFQCSYLDICTADLFSGNSELLVRQRYKVGDPMDYYNDERPGQEEKGD
jgi:hypothetical protein